MGKGLRASCMPNLTLRAIANARLSCCGCVTALSIEWISRREVDNES
jgi:hypothetical protein